MLKLNAQDKGSSLWQRLDRHLREELARAREANDGFHDQLKTERLRGKIAFIKELIELGTSEEDTEGGSE